uniref:Hydroxymethylpyrimidine/phosphomethylpyrimidine kinase n=1 Tax=Archaeoglobus fulgidus TaxID=2234 RepID=A0A7C2SP38_ARCFL
MKTILTASGLDPSGGAGLHADIKTAKAIGLYPASVVTSLTVQNTCEVKMAVSVDTEILKKQIEAVTEDIRIDCVKIGLISSAEVARVVADEIAKLDAPKVLDPVIFAGAGGKIGNVEGYRMLLEFVDVVTPNLTEARSLASADSLGNTLDEAVDLALKINEKYGCNVVITGGELGGRDVVCENGSIYTVTADFSPINIHGTGCVYSTSLACYLGLGNSLDNAVRRARIFVLESVKKALRPGNCFPVVNP